VRCGGTGVGAALGDPAWPARSRRNGAAARIGRSVRAGSCGWGRAGLGRPRTVVADQSGIPHLTVVLPWTLLFARRLGSGQSMAPLGLGVSIGLATLGGDVPGTLLPRQPGCWCGGGRAVPDGAQGPWPALLGVRILCAWAAPATRPSDRLWNLGAALLVSAQVSSRRRHFPHGSGPVVPFSDRPVGTVHSQSARAAVARVHLLAISRAGKGTALRAQSLRGPPRWPASGCGVLARAQGWVRALGSRGGNRAFILATGDETPLWGVTHGIFTHFRYPSKLAPYAVISWESSVR